MALHDPDSTAQEKAIALKIGRQKKIQIIDGQQVRSILFSFYLCSVKFIEFKVYAVQKYLVKYK